MTHADMAAIVLKVFTQSFGKSHVNEAKYNSRNVCAQGMLHVFCNHSGRNSFDEFCGFQSPGNPQRRVCLRKGREEDPRPGEDCAKAEKCELAHNMQKGGGRELGRKLD